jgi:hypothetical protein
MTVASDNIDMYALFCITNNLNRSKITVNSNITLRLEKANLAQIHFLAAHTIHELVLIEVTLDGPAQTDSSDACIKNTRPNGSC